MQEQDPKTPVLKVRNQSLPSHTATQPEPRPARTESELNPLRMSQQTMQNAYSQQAVSFLRSSLGSVADVLSNHMIQLNTHLRITPS